MLCLLQANLDPAHTPLASQVQRTQLPGLRVAKRMEVGLGWLLARPPGGCWSRALAQRRDRRLSQLHGCCQRADTAVVVLSNTARSVGRLGLRLLKALASGAGQGVG
jgi:hypothetical protein